MKKKAAGTENRAVRALNGTFQGPDMLFKGNPQSYLTEIQVLVASEDVGADA